MIMRKEINCSFPVTQPTLENGRRNKIGSEKNNWATESDLKCCLKLVNYWFSKIIIAKLTNP